MTRFDGSLSRATLRLGSALAVLALGSAVPTLAHAQQAPQADTPAPADAPSAEIVVTGSRVKVDAPVGSTVTALGRTEIESAGRVTLDRAIKDLPQVFDLGVSENSRGQSGGSGNIVYGNSINLRGIGPNATLILIDGHRVTNNSRSTDPSVLPTLGVERVEVVADGASAIYGSDAVAGVVNLIPRRNLNGVEAFLRAGVSDDGVYFEQMGGVAVGKKWSRGQVMLAYEHVLKSNLNGQDRAFFTSNQTPFGGNDYRVLKCDPGTIRATVAGVATSYAIPAGGVTSPGQLTAGTSNKCDDLAGQDLAPRQRYDSVNGTATYELTDWLTFFMDGFYSYRRFDRLPAYTNATLTMPQTNAFFVRPAGFTGTSYALDYNFALDVPRNLNFGHGESWQVTPGLRVELPHGFEFEALVDKGRTDDNALSLNGVSNAALNAALASSNPATAFDPYGLHRTTAATVNGIFNQISINPTIGHFTGYEARINGPLFRLPGGEVKLAAGYEGQELSVDLGIARGNPGTPVTFRTFGRRVDSAYGELLVPIFGPDNAMPGFERLEIDAAVRYDKYSDVGKTTNPKVGVNWTPVKGLLLRGSYGTSFRAPTIPQIYGNSNSLFVQSYQNPAGGAPITGVALSGGNLGLKPETATTYSFGFDWTPVRNVKLSATYFSVDYKNQVIALLSDLAVLGRLSQFDGTGLITQGAAAGAIVQNYINQGISVTGALPGGSASNVTLFVDGRSQNLGRSLTRGIDFNASWRIETGRMGAVTLGASGTYLTKFFTQQTPAAPFIDQRNQIFQPLKFKARVTANWDIGRVSVLGRLTHVNGYTNTLITPNQTVRSYNPFDLNLTFRAGNIDKPMTFGIEVRNLFDEHPPYVNLAPSANGSGGYDATLADPIGRVVAFTVRKSF